MVSLVPAKVSLNVESQFSSQGCLEKIPSRSSAESSIGALALLSDSHDVIFSFSKIMSFQFEKYV